MLELKNIKKQLGGKEILKDVSLSIEEGEVVVILGPSGSGKTTLLRTINFLGPADSGTVSIDGLTVDSCRAKRSEVQEIRKKTAMVFQHYNLFRNRTALKNVTEGMVRVQKVPKKEAERRAMELLENVNLADRANAYPSQLSGGQQQRVGICRALALNPKVILFDEPTSALDPELVGEVLATMRAVAATGITMIVVTHEISFAKEVADRVLYMEGGVIVEEGVPKEILENPKDEKTIRFLSSLLGEYTDYSI
ncbi:MAG: amino acid ABC transporter ATP-binding protein [Clostridiales bacterium]|nr:amino acid ABC transporter ATP-binding protein [Clostridiales bacterium]